MKFYAIKEGNNPGIYTDIFEVFDNLRLNDSYFTFRKENDARDFMGYPRTDELENECYKGLKKYSFKEIKNNSIKPYGEMIGKNNCIAYVDGSYNEKDEIYGAGVVFMTDNKIYTANASYRDKFKKYKNVSGEILGAIMAIDLGIDFGFNNITIFHDFQLPHSSSEQNIGAKSPITNIFLEYLSSVRCMINCKFEKVKAHSGDYYNEKADDLAKSSCFLKYEGKNLNLLDYYINLNKNNLNKNLVFA